MNHQKPYDIIIAGAGAFGLSLLWHLLHSEKLRSKNILLLDKNLEPNDHKTWCFWDDGSYQFKDSIYHTWNQIRVNTSSAAISETLQRYQYHCVRSIDFSSKILKLAADRENVSLLRTNVIDFEFINGLAHVHTSSGTFMAHRVFQSALKPKDFEQQKSDISLSQHFLGWEIEVNQELFNPNEAILMDFESSQEHGFAFMYLLPFTKKKALVEYTLFSENLLKKEEYESEIVDYLGKNYGLTFQDFNILRREIGNIPMEDRKYSTMYCEKVFNCGTIGGFTKPSTGYTFRRIQKQCKKIVDDLEYGKPVKIGPASSYRFRVYDMMLLYNHKHDQKESLRIFHDLFSKNGFDRVFKFLDEKTSFLEELSIFTSFSPLPFLNSIYRMKHRIFRGA